MNNQQIINELHRKYDGTYIFSKDSDGNPFLCYVDSISSVGEGNDAVGLIKLLSKKYGRLEYKIPSNEAITFKHPPTGTFQNGAHAFFSSRLPARQWQRGITPNNTIIANLSTYVLEGCISMRGGNNTQFNMDMVSSMFEGKAYSYKEAMKMITSGKYCSVAIKGNYAVVLPIDESSDHLLLHRTAIVAYVRPDGSITKIVNGSMGKTVRELVGE